MSVEFQVQNQGGQTGSVDPQYILSQLQEAGYNPQGVSADGMKITFADGQGSYDVKTHDALSELGWQVSGSKPLDADYGNVQPGWRAAVLKLPDDDTRKAYIEGQLRKAGQPDPQIMGSGRDWYVYNPQTSQYIGVTNSPDWDSSDAVEFGLEAPKMIASGLGGAAGAVGGGGVASLATGALGAGLAGGGVDALERAGIAAADPVYRDILRQNLGKSAFDIGKGAALDAASMGLVKGLPMAARAINPMLGSAVGAVAEAAPLSRGAQVAGRAMDLAGGATKTLASAADNTIGRDIATFGIPGASELSSAGYLAQVPSMLTKAPVQGMEALGKSELLQAHAPKVAGWLRRQAGDLTRRSSATSGFAEEAQQGLEQFAKKMAINPQSAAARAAEEGGHSMAPSTIMENLFRKTSDRLGKLRGAPRNAAGTDLDAYRMARQFGLTPQEARSIAAEDSSEWLAKQAARGNRAGSAGRKVGQVVESLDQLGDHLQRGSQAVGAGIIKGVKGAGAATQATGRALRGAGTITQPLESRAALRYGTEEAYGHDIDEWNPLRRRRGSRTMEPEQLAQSNYRGIGQ